MNKKKYLLYVVGVFIFVFIAGFVINFLASKFLKIDLFSAFKNTVAQKLNINQIQNSSEEVDERPLELEYSDKKREVYEVNTAIGVMSNKDIVVDENNKYKLVYIKDNHEGKKYYALEI